MRRSIHDLRLSYPAAVIRSIGYVCASVRAGLPLVISTTEEGQTTRFYLREARLTDNSELVMITYGAKETVVVNIYGAFDLRQVMRLSSIRPQ